MAVTRGACRVAKVGTSWAVIWFVAISCGSHAIKHKVIAQKSHDSLAAFAGEIHECEPCVCVPCGSLVSLIRSQENHKENEHVEDLDFVVCGSRATL